MITTLSSLKAIFSRIRFTIFCFVVLASFCFGVSSTSAQVTNLPTNTTVELNGYAWSSTIGWISLNCRTGSATGGNVCNSSNYKVTINPTTNNVEGYAWSSNIGWIRFGGLTASAMPAAPGATAVNAQAYGSYPNDVRIRGWARACGVLQPGCGSTLLPQTERGGWDGWISLQGTTAVGGSYGVRLQNGTPHYAWGSTNVGWVDMSSRVSLLAPAPPTLVGTPCAQPIPSGQSTCTGQLTWTTDPSVANPQVVRTFPPTETVGTGQTGTNVSVTLRPGTNTFQLRDGTNTLLTRQLSAACFGGASPVGGVCPEVVGATPPTISINAQRSLLRQGEQAQLNVVLSRPTVPGETCRVTGGGMNQVVGASETIPSDPVYNQIQFNLICTGMYGEVRATPTVVQVVPNFNEI